MRVVVQRALNAKVVIDNKVNGEIEKGYVLLVGFTYGDDLTTLKKVARKVANLRIFEDENGKMNLSLRDINGDILSISQFTLYGDVKEGNRPSFVNALSFDEASKLYDLFNLELKNYDYKVETGVFGADMKVSFTNDGPVTILIDSKDLK